MKFAKKRKTEGGRKKIGEEHGYGGGSGYRKSGYGEEVVEEGTGGYGGGRTTYDRPSLGGEEEGAGRYQEPSHYGGQDYGRKKYGADDSDDEEKKRHHHKHHRHHNYDDE